MAKIQLQGNVPSAPKSWRNTSPSIVPLKSYVPLLHQGSQKTLLRLLERTHCGDLDP